MNALSKIALGLMALTTVSVAVAASSLTEKPTAPVPMGVCDTNPDLPGC